MKPAVGNAFYDWLMKLCVDGEVLGYDDPIKNHLTKENARMEKSYNEGLFSIRVAASDCVMSLTVFMTLP